MKYQITMAAWFLHSIDLSFYQHGTVDEHGKKLWDFYQCDGVTPEQRLKILEWCPNAIFQGSYKQYAPELTSTLVCFPKAEQMRRMRA